MPKSYPPIWAVVCLLVWSCGGSISAENPFDPEGTGPKAPGKIEGQVLIEGRADQGGVRIDIIDDDGAVADSPTTEAGTGRFVTTDITPGKYDLVVDVPLENVPTQRNGIEVLPGQTANVGLLVSYLYPPQGTLAGRVVQGLKPDQGIGFVTVQLLRTGSDGVTAVYENTSTGPDGDFDFDTLPPGTYEVIAERDGYTFDRAAGIQIDAPARDVDETLSQPLELYPASAVVRFSVEQDDGTYVDGAPYTKRNDVDLLLLAFGGVNQMRVSDDPDMTLGTGDEVLWESHLATKPVSLSAGEGRKTTYAQFRVVDGVDVRLESSIYSATIVLDQTPPILDEVIIDPTATVVDGARYIQADPTAVPVRVIGLDPLSFLDGFKVVTGATDPATVPFAEVATDNPVAIYDTTIALDPTGDGVKDVTIVMTDGAGNESVAQTFRVVVDTTPPAILSPPGEPAIAVSPVVGSALTSLTPTLIFLVGEDAGNGIDGPVRMRFGTSQLNLGPWTGFQPAVTTSISLGEGQPVQFFAEFADAAGNVTPADSAALSVKLTGKIGGTIFLEGQAEANNPVLSNILIDIFDSADDPTEIPAPTPVQAAVTVDTYGDFTSDDLPAGEFLVRFSFGGYVTEMVAPILVRPATIANMGVRRLARARGELDGYFRLGDRTGDLEAHANILVEALLAGAEQDSTLTDETGYFSFAGGSALPVGNYTLRASYEDYAAASAAVTVVTNTLVTVSTNIDPLLLNPVAGDFAICDRDDTPGNCDAIAYTNETEVMAGFALPAVAGLWVRYGLETFTNPGGTPFDDACTAGAVPPEEQCWNGYDPAEAYLVNLAGASDGQVTIVAQFQLDVDPPDDEKASAIIFDRTPPAGVSMSVHHAGSSAAIDGFTNAVEVQLQLAADPGGIPDQDVAPLGTVFVARSSAWDAGQGSRQYAKPGSVLFDLAAVEGEQTLFAWFCDLAGNCTPDCTLADPAATCGDSQTEAAQASIVFDVQKPATTTPGVTRAPTGPSISSKAADVWWTRAQSYDVIIGVGDTGFVTPGGAVIPHVVATQVSLSPSFSGASWTQFDFETFAGPTHTAAGAILPFAQGDYPVHVRVRDPAGNVSDDMPFTLSLDLTPPSGTVIVGTGTGVGFAPRDFTNIVDPATMTARLTTDADATAAAVEIQTSWTGALPDPFTGGRQTYADDVTVTVPNSAGEALLLVRFFDAAGNFVERSDTIVVDLTDPDASASVTCTSCITVGGTRYYNDDLGGAVMLSFFATDDSGWLAGMDIVVDGGVPARYDYTLLRTQPLPAVTGLHEVDVTYYDPAGNTRAAPQLDLFYDDVLPTVSLLINGVAAGTATDADVQLAITAADNYGLVSMEVANSATYAGASVLAPTDTLNWRLSTPESSGLREVFVRVTDVAGNIAETSQTITLDLLADVDGKVSLDGPNVADNSGVAVQLTGTTTTGGTVSLSATTNAAGDYSFSNVAAGSYSVAFSRVGFTSASTAFTLQPGIDQTLASVTLVVRKAKVSGTVAVGAGTTGLSLTGSEVGIPISLANTTSTFSTTTGAGGAFTFNDVFFDLGDDYTVTAAGFGWASQNRVVNVDQASVTVPLMTLPVAAGSLTGIATLGFGSDHSTISVTLSGVAFNEASYSAGPVTTNGTGSFSFAALPAGTYSLAFSHTGFVSASYGPFVLAPTETKNLGASPVTTLAISTSALSGTATLNLGTTGLTVDAAGTLITIANASRSLSTTTNASGAYVFAAVPYSLGENYTVTASRPYFTSQISAAFAVATSSLAAGALILPVKSAGVSGQVELAASSDDAGVTATLSGTAFNGEGYTKTTTSTDSDGSGPLLGAFAFAGVPPGTYAVTLSNTGYQSGTSGTFAVEPPTAVVLPAVTLLPRAATVSGAVSYDPGASALDVGSTAGGVAVTLSNGYASLSTVTSSSGAFIFNGVPFEFGDNYTLGASSYGYANDTISVNVDQATVIDQDITLLPTLTTVTGNILQPDGSHENTTATLTGIAFNGTDFAPAPVVTIPSGNFTFSNIPAGSYTVRLSLTNHETMTTAVFAVEPGTAFSLGALGTLALLPGDIGGNVSLGAGAVTGFSPGSNFSGIAVRLTVESEVWVAITDGSGDYTFSDVPVGAHTLAVGIPNYASDSDSVTVVASSTVSAPALTMNVMSATATANVCVRDDVGGVAGCTASATIDLVLNGTAFNGTSFTRSTSTTGTVVNFTVPPGTYRIDASSAKHDDDSETDIIVPTTAPDVPPVAPAAVSLDLFDNIPPTTPSISTDHASPIHATEAVTVKIVVASTDATSPASNLAGYQLFGGEDREWNDTIETGDTHSFILRPNQTNVLQVRAVDHVGNVSAADSVVLVHDSIAPGVPGDPNNVVTVTDRDGEVEVHWEPAIASDLGGYLLYYGSGPIGDAGDADVTLLQGNFADQGPSPIDVGRNNTFRLTGLVNETNFRVGILAYDQTQEAHGAGAVAPNVSGAWDVGHALPVELPLHQVNSTHLSGARDLAVSGGYVFVTSTVAGLTVFRIEDLIASPAAMPVAQLATHKQERIRLFGDVAYLYGRSTSRIAVVDIAAPEALGVLPNIVGSNNRCYHTLVTGHRLQWATGSYMYGVYQTSANGTCTDIPGPPNNIFIHRFRLGDPRAPTSVNFGPFASVPANTIVDDTQLVTADETGVGVVQLHVAMAQAFGGNLESRQALPPASTPNYFVINVDNPGVNPNTVKTSFAMGQNEDSPGTSFEVSGHLLFNAADTHGFDIMIAQDDPDGSCPPSGWPPPPGELPECRGESARTVATVSRLGDIEIIGNLLIASTRDSRSLLTAWDISDLLAPALIGAAETPDSLGPGSNVWDSRLEIVGNNALVVARPAADPTTAQIVAFDLAEARYLHPRLRVSDGYLTMPVVQRTFFFGFERNLRLYDIHDLDAPVPLPLRADLPSVYTTDGVTKLIDDGRHLVAVYPEGVGSFWNAWLLDVSYPAFTRTVGFVMINDPDLGSTVRDIEVVGDLLLLSESNNRLRVFDLSDVSFNLIASATSGVAGTELSVVGNTVYTGAGDASDALCITTFDTSTLAVADPDGTCQALTTANIIDPQSVRARGGDLIVVLSFDDGGLTKTTFEMYDRPTLMPIPLSDFMPFADSLTSTEVYGTRLIMSRSTGIAIYDISSVDHPEFEMFQGGSGGARARIAGPYVISGEGALQIQQMK